MKKPLIFKTFFTLGTTLALVLSTLSISLARPGRGPFKDTNGDGLISRQEFMESVTKKFNTRDQDGDGTITLTEVKSHAETKFTEIDSDQDGVVTREELRAHRRARHQRQSPE